ncbi:MAG: hypothetical protein OHK93_002390 [Ramalina farinacea]|uniref:CFEM domain-containing protein n=1 Tax=Ramalina farinacea TaxID=258253 RepID=A0AA43QUL0_9LECA|nr:hypothetical protein [Ramalina farinacea]
MLQLSLVLSVFAFATWCSAQVALFSALPDCAVRDLFDSSQTSLTGVWQKSCANSLPTNCNLDVKCICADSSFISSISCCVAKACTDADVQKTLQAASQLCDTVNVQLPSAVPATCTASSGGSTSAVAPTSQAATGKSMSSATPTMSGSGVTDSPSTTTSATGSVTSTGSAAGNSNGATGHRVSSRFGALGAAVAALALF